MIQNYFHNVKIFLGSLIPNARVWAGGTRTFTLKNRRLAREAGKGGVPAAPAARQSINFVQNRFGFGCINALNLN